MSITVPSNIRSELVSPVTGEKKKITLTGNIISVALLSDCSEFVTDGSVNILNIAQGSEIVVSGFSNTNNNGSFTVKDVSETSLFVYSMGTTNEINPATFEHKYTVNALHVSYSGGGGGGSCHFDGIYSQPSGHVSGNSLQEWIDIHFVAQSPIVHINSVNPLCGYREFNDTITNPVIQFSATRGANGNSLDRFEITRNGTLVHTESSVDYGTVYTFNDTYNTDTVNTTYIVRAIDVSGRVNSIDCSYIFTYPHYATTVNITTLTKQPLASLTSSYFQMTMVAESSSSVHQMADFETANITITGIEFYNTVSGQWEWLAGSKANSLNQFDTSSVTHTVQGSVVNYTRFTNNNPQTGSRQLRFWRV